MKKRIGISLALLLGMASMPLCADEQEYLVFESGTESVSIPLSDIRKLTVENGSIIKAIKKDNSFESFQIRDLSSLYFDMKTTGIHQTELNGKNLSYDADQAMILVSEGNTAGVLSVYNMQGMTVRRETISASGGSCSLQGLASGIYVIQYKGQSLKIVKP